VPGVSGIGVVIFLDSGKRFIETRYETFNDRFQAAMDKISKRINRYLRGCMTYAESGGQAWRFVPHHAFGLSGMIKSNMGA